MTLRDRAAIVGIGATEFSKNSGRTELRLALEAIFAALEDAGLAPQEVDGFCTYTLDESSEITIQRHLGIPALRFFSRIPYGGGGACGPIHQAAIAVASGAADVVVCYRALNERSGVRFGSGKMPVPVGSGDLGWYHPFGLVTPGSMAAIVGQRYLHEYGGGPETFGHITVSARRHAATNPAAHFYERPLTMEAYLESPFVSRPLRILDCCLETDGAVAVVVTSAERARDLKQKPAIIRAATQASGARQEGMVNYYKDDMLELPDASLLARELFGVAGIGPEDIDVAMLYDHFTPLVLLQLEQLGFCGRGEGGAFIADGGLGIGGRLPVNTHGGHLGEGYIHGMNGVAEGVRQIRGTAVNQVPDAQHVLVAAAPAVPCSGFILGSEPGG